MDAQHAAALAPAESSARTATTGGPVSDDEATELFSSLLWL